MLYQLSVLQIFLNVESSEHLNTCELLRDYSVSVGGFVECRMRTD